MNHPPSHRYQIAVIAIFVLLAGAVSLLNPLFEPTDEIRHYRYIRILTTEHRLPVQDEEAARAQSHHPPLYYTLATLLSGWIPTPHDGAYRHPGNPFWGYRNWAVGVDNKLQYRHGPAEAPPFRDGYLAAVGARWVNVAIGTGVVVATFALAVRILNGDHKLALAASAIVALNPQFVYLSGAINNDILATLMSTAVLLACVITLRRGLTLRRAAVLGMLYGLALLTKLHLGVLGPIIAATFALEAWRVSRNVADAGRRRQVGYGLWRWSRSMIVVATIAGAVAGWWFLRNLSLYGDLTGMSRLNAMWAGREVQGNFWAVRQGLPFLWASLWGRFGYGQIPLPTWIYTAWLIFCGVALAGLVLGKVAWRLIPGGVSGVGTSSMHDGAAHCVGPAPTTNLLSPFSAEFALLAITIVLFLAIVIYYIMIQPAGAMGRFLFPALPAFAILITAGLQAWLRRSTWVGAGVTTLMVGLAVVALGGYWWPAVRYPVAVSSAVSGDPATDEVQVADVARIQDVVVRPATVRPGQPVFVDVVWEPLRWTDVPYAVFVHLVDETGALVAQRDTWPGLGRAPTTSWRRGVAFQDTYRVDLPDSLYSPNHLTAYVGLYEPTRGRLPLIIDGAPAPLVDTLAIGEVDVLPAAGPWPNAFEANFADRVALVGYTIAPRVVAPGDTATITLYWQVLDTVGDDIQVFAQVVDEAYQVWGSRDGGHPAWASGIVSETRKITLIPETPPGSYPIQVGLFSSERRLPVIGPDGHHLGERVLLGPIRVTE